MNAIPPRYRAFQLVARWGKDAGEVPIAVPISGLIVEVQPTRHYRVLNHSTRLIERWAEATILRQFDNTLALDEAHFAARQLAALYTDLKAPGRHLSTEVIVKAGRAIQSRINQIYGA